MCCAAQLLRVEVGVPVHTTQHPWAPMTLLLGWLLLGPG